MIDLIRLATTFPGFGGGSSAPSPPPLPPPLPAPPAPVAADIPKPPTPVDDGVLEAKKAAKKDAQRRRGTTDSIKTGPQGLADDADTTKKSLIG